jgi:WhiB family redox-sensing transcriptional regulator
MSARPGRAQAGHRPQPQETDLRWQERALCKQVDPELFFPFKGEVAVANAAKQVCGMCEVRAECLAYALAHHEYDGIWGGTSDRERRRQRRRLRRAS